MIAKEPRHLWVTESQRLLMLRLVIEVDAEFQLEVSASKDGKYFCVQVHGVQLTSLPSAFVIYFTLPPSPSASGEAYLASKMNVKVSLSLKSLDSTRYSLPPLCSLPPTLDRLLLLFCLLVIQRTFGTRTVPSAGHRVWHIAVAFKKKKKLKE